MPNLPRFTLHALTLTTCIVLQSPLYAQATPSTAEMVEQLKVQPAGAPRTRGLRNLTVEVADAAPAARPSL